MIRFGRKNVVVEVKHPRRLKKGSSIWGSIDLDKHSKDVSTLLPGTPEESDEALQVEKTTPAPNPTPVAAEVEHQERGVGRILEDQQQLAGLKAAAEAEKRLIEAALEEEEQDFWGSRIADVLGTSNEVAETPSDEDMVASEVEPETTTDKPKQKSEPANIKQQEFLFDIPSETAASSVDVTASDVQPADGAEPENSEVEDDVETLEADEVESVEIVTISVEEMYPEVDFEVEPAVEASIQQASEAELLPAQGAVAVDNRLTRDQLVLGQAAVERIRGERFKKVTGVRYVRRPDGIKVAREDKWKVRRLFKAPHL